MASLTRSDMETSEAIRLLAPRAPRQWRGYALAWQTWRCGSIRIDVPTVADLHERIDPEALLRDPLAPEPPYWAHLWPGSRALARYLVEHRWFVNGPCLDVGCGLGLVAVVLARLGGNVFAFDRERDAVAFCQLAARHNGMQVHTFCENMQQFALRQKVQLICAADVTYDAGLQGALLDLAEQALRDEGVLLCSESVRTFDFAWLDLAKQRGFSVQQSDVEEVEDGRPVRVRIVEMRRRARLEGSCPSAHADRRGI